MFTASLKAIFITIVVLFALLGVITATGQCLYHSIGVATLYGVVAASGLGLGLSVGCGLSIIEGAS